MGTGETATLRAECEGYNRGYIDFEVQVPRQTAALTLETKGGIVSAKMLPAKLTQAPAAVIFNWTRLAVW